MIDNDRGNALSFYAPRLLLHISRLCEVAGPKTCYRVFPCTCRKNQRDWVQRNKLIYGSSLRF